MSFKCPEFIVRGYTPYKVINCDSRGFLALDMLDGAIDRVNPPEYIDSYVNNRIWPCKPNGKGMEAYNSDLATKIIFYFNSDYLISRDDGPAYINIEPGGNIIKKYFLNGHSFNTPEEWFNSLPDKKKAVFNLDQILEK